MFIFDYSLLRGRIREYYKTESKFAIALRNSNIEMSAGSFSNKINGKVDFKQTEILVICDLLKIPHKEISEYFFKKKYEFNS